MKKTLTRLFALVLTLAMFLCGVAVAEVTASVAEIAKYGNLVLNITGAELFAQGYAYGDMLSVTILDQAWELPLGSNYSDVDTGLPIVRAAAEEETVVIAINMGDLATAAGIAAGIQL